MPEAKNMVCGSKGEVDTIQLGKALTNSQSALECAVSIGAALWDSIKDGVRKRPIAYS